MKKIILAAALLLSTSVFAQTVGFVNYDYDRDMNRGDDPWKSQHELMVGARTTTAVGKLDAALVVGQLVTNDRDNTVGIEVGYSNGVKMGPVGLVGRVSYGYRNEVETDFPGYDGNSSYYGLGGEANLVLTPGMTGFVGYRYRGGVGSDPMNQNRYIVGADFKFTPVVTMRAGYAYTNQNGTTFSGLTSSFNYSF